MRVTAMVCAVGLLLGAVLFAGCGKGGAKGGSEDVKSAIGKAPKAGMPAGKAPAATKAPGG
jgi:hypothetical protein